MNEEKMKLDEKKILKRLSNGEMLLVNGGANISSLSDVETQPALENCLAGCGCEPNRACSVCQA